MPVRLVALDEGPDIPLDREMLVVGRHPQCDARLDSIRVSRRHCCMTPDNGEVIVKDLGSTNGIRINGQRVEKGRLRPGDELSIAHIRYRFEDGRGQEMTMADPQGERNGAFGLPPIPGNHVDGVAASASAAAFRIRPPATPSKPMAVVPPGAVDENSPLAAAVRDLLPAGMADKCRIQVIVHQLPQDDEDDESCRPDSSL
jgi:predicted component of type VI protein secretion system